MSIEVLDPGPLTTLQDRGRRGDAHLGVPRGGALDRGAAALALRLVGGDPDDAVLETTMGGVSVRTPPPSPSRSRGPTALSGSAAGPRVTRNRSTVPADSVITVGPATTGVRSYLAFAGGLAVPPVLGSRCTDTLAWVGPPRLAAGQVLALGAAGRLPRVPEAVVVRPREPVLHLQRGPRADWVDGEVWATLDGACVRRGRRQDRIGLRLTGPALARRAGELASEGIVTGGVQLPPSGQPVVFLRTTRRPAATR